MLAHENGRCLWVDPARQLLDSRLEIETLIIISDVYGYDGIWIELTSVFRHPPIWLLSRAQTRTPPRTGVSANACSMACIPFGFESGGPQ